MDAYLVLGSASPRRAELLARLGLAFTQASADIDETPRAGEDPRAYVARMAREKAAALRGTGMRDLLLTADTTVVIDGESLGKPVDGSDARAMLRRLSGRRHAVWTAICCSTPDRREERSVATEVEFMTLSEALIDAYLATPEPWDKAGAYALQGLAGSFVRSIRGSVSNVIGLPLVETREILAAFDVYPGVASP
jgi:septum formation protein